MNFQRHSFAPPGTPRRKARIQSLAAYSCPSCQWQCRFCPFCGNSLQDVVENSCPSSSCAKQIFSTSTLRYCLQCGEGLSIKEVQVAPVDPRQVKSGILCVKRKHTHKLKSHVYVLRDQFLYTFNKHHDTAPLRVTFIEGLLFEEVNSGPACFENFFAISMKSPDHDRVEWLYALSQEDRSAWIQALRMSAHTIPITDLYEISDQIGVGKFGKVFTGIDIATREKVAIKKIEKRNLTGEEKENLRGEIAIMRLLEHKNITRLHHVFETKIETCLVTDLASNGDLLVNVCKGDFPEAKSFKVIEQIVCGLEYLHTRGIVHRDLKLENVLMCDEICDRILLTDFGLSKFVIGKHKEMAAGTILYVAPEVLTQNAYTPSSDMWSLGVLLYVLLVEDFPWKGVGEISDDALRRIIIRGQPSFEQEEWKHVPPSTRAVVEALLCTNPDKRLTIPQLREHEWWVNHLQARKNVLASLPNDSPTVPTPTVSST